MKDLITKAKVRANDTRNAFGLGDEPISDIFLLLERQGIFLFLKPLESNASALFMKMKKTHLVIINSNRTLGHQIFSAAHELSHFLFDKHLTGGICVANKRDQNLEVEKLADLFAAYFLMPEEGLLKHLAKRKKDLHTKLTIPDLISLQQYFKVSWAAMLYRLLNMQLLTHQEVEQLRSIPITREALKLGYELDLYRTNQKEIVSKKYLEQVNFAYENHEISKKKFDEYLLDVGIDSQYINEEEVPDA